MPRSPLLCYITDRKAFPGDESARRNLLLQKIAEAARAEVHYIQLREKDLSAHELQLLAQEAVRIIRDESRTGTENSDLKNADPNRRTTLLINSRTDIALASNADGVHLRSDDVSPQEIRRIWSCVTGTPFDKLRASSARQLSPREPIIGVSCHSPSEVSRAAANGADFAVFAPIFEKEGAFVRGLAALEALREACRAQIPVLALGGITLDNARSCLDAGASGIAAIRLFQENNTAAIVHRLRSANA